MKEGEPKELDAPASERARRPSAHSGTPAAIGEELGKLEFEPDALLDGLFGEGSAPPPVAERPSFAPVPVKHSSIPPAPSQEPPRYGDDEPTSVFWRVSPSSEPPPSSSLPPSSGSGPPSAPTSSERLPFESTPAPENLEPESFLPPPDRDDDVERAFARVSSPAPRDPDEAERTVRRSLGPFASLSQPPELEESERTARRSSIDPKELAALRQAAKSARAVAKLPSQPPEPLEVERTVRRTVEPVEALPSQPSAPCGARSARSPPPSRRTAARPG
jgi:hypothetical protein